MTRKKILITLPPGASSDRGVTHLTGREGKHNNIGTFLVQGYGNDNFITLTDNDSKEVVA